MEARSPKRPTRDRPKDPRFGLFHDEKELREWVKERISSSPKAHALLIKL